MKRALRSAATAALVASVGFLVGYGAVCIALDSVIR